MTGRTLKIHLTGYARIALHFIAMQIRPTSALLRTSLSESKPVPILRWQYRQQVTSLGRALKTVGNLPNLSLTIGDFFAIRNRSTCDSNRKQVVEVLRP